MKYKKERLPDYLLGIVFLTQFFNNLWAFNYAQKCFEYVDRIKLLARSVLGKAGRSTYKFKTIEFSFFVNMYFRDCTVKI